jgi:hypothetical protein
LFTTRLILAIFATATDKMTTICTNQRSTPLLSTGLIEGFILRLLAVSVKEADDSARPEGSFDLGAVWRIGQVGGTLPQAGSMQTPFLE